MTVRNVAAGREAWSWRVDGSLHPDAQAQRVRLDLVSPVVGCNEATPPNPS